MLSVIKISHMRMEGRWRFSDVMVTSTCCGRDRRVSLKKSDDNDVICGWMVTRLRDKGVNR